MKKPIIALFFLAFLSSFSHLTGQNSVPDLKYRRSSLSMILIDSESFPNKEAVSNSWKNYPFPDKYNEHDIQTKSFNINNITLTDTDLFDAGFLQDTINTSLKIASTSKPLRFINKEKSIAVVLPTKNQEYKIKIDKVIKEDKIADQLIATWFDLGNNGKFDMSLIQKRGFYNATELEASIAKGQTRGLASLGDAGEQLIKNTFVTFTELEFKDNEPAARAVRDATKATIEQTMGGKSQLIIDLAMKAADKTYEKAKEGYSLWSKTWLYQLNWNDSTAAIFYNDLWNNPSKLENSDLFHLKFIGVQNNHSLVTFKLGEKRTKEQIIDLALVRNIDNAFAKLQKQNDVFKPKVPVLTSDPITAQIGMKEGLSGGEKFDVLEMTINKKTGLTEYKEIGTATVDKKEVWDNRYNAGAKIEPTLDKDGHPIIATSFKGSKKIQPGMLLKIAK